MRTWELGHKEAYEFIRAADNYVSSEKEAEGSRLQVQFNRVTHNLQRHYFIDEKEGAQVCFMNAWLSAAGQSSIGFTQNDMGGISRLFALRLQEELSEEERQGDISQATDDISFNYRNAENEICNFSLLYSTEHLNCWLLIIQVNANCPEIEKRALVSVSGFSLDLFNTPEELADQARVNNVFSEIENQINSPAIFGLFQHMFSSLTEESHADEICINPKFVLAFNSAISEAPERQTLPDGMVKLFAKPSEILGFLEGKRVKKGFLGRALRGFKTHRDPLLTGDDSKLKACIYFNEKERAFRLLSEGCMFSGDFKFENIYDRSVNHLITLFSHIHACIPSDFASDKVDALRVFITEAFSDESDSEYESVRDAVSKVLFSEEVLFSFLPEASYLLLKRALSAALASIGIYYAAPSDNPYEGVDLTDYCQAMGRVGGAAVSSAVVGTNGQIQARIWRLSYKEGFFLSKHGEVYPSEEKLRSANSKEGREAEERVIRGDFPRTRFFDENLGVDFFRTAWLEGDEFINYTQGDMMGGPFAYFIYNNLSMNDPSLIGDKEIVSIGFCYRNSNEEICSFALIYEKEDVGRWILSVMRNANCPEAEKTIWLNAYGWEEGLDYFSLTEEQKNPVLSTDFYELLEDQIQSPPIFKLLKERIFNDEFRVNDAFPLEFKKQFKEQFKKLNEKKSAGKSQSGEISNVVVMKPSNFYSIWSNAQASEANRPAQDEADSAIGASYNG